MLFRFLALITFASVVPLAHATWPVLYDGPEQLGADGMVVRVDDGGNVYLAARVYHNGSNPYLGVTKYGRTGSVLWSTIYGTNDHYQNPVDMVIDAQKNVYVTSQNRDNGQYQWGTTKFGSQGAFRWIQYRAAASNRQAVPRSIKLAPDGDIVVTGIDETSTDIYEIAVVQYHPSGAVKWSQTYSNGLPNLNPANTAVASDGSIAVAGTQFVSGHGLDLLAIKYDSVGNRQWIYTYDGAAHGDDAGADVAFDSTGNVVVGGQTTYLPNGSSNSPTLDFLTLKLNPNGQKLWTSRYGTEDRNEMIRYIGVDSQDNVVVAGNPFEGFDSNVITVKINPEGTRLWVKKYDGMVGGSAALCGLAVGTDDSIYVGGSTFDSLGTEAFMMLKYSPEGTRRYAHSATNNDGAYAQMASMAYDPKSNHVFGTGVGGSGGMGKPAMTTRF